MFGILRYLLALFVVVYHLVDLPTNTGPIAVFSFYLLSGYLMTYVLQRSYGFQLGGTKRFLVNRFLRIFPPYWVAFGLAWVVFHAFPQETADFCVSCVVGEDPMTDLKIFAKTILLVGANTAGKSTLVPPAWSLNVEFFFYIAMALLLARKRWMAWAWFGLSVGALALMLVWEWDWETIYFSKAGGAMPFALGSILYFEKDRFKVPKWLFVGACLGYAANFAVTPLMDGGGRLLSIYASLPFMFVMTAFLKDIRPKKHISSPLLRRTDQLLGDLSYPIFLIHYSFAVLGLAFLPPDFMGSDWNLFFWTLIPIHLAALAIHFGVEKPINRIRDRVRNRNRAA